jgi:hypothetical protein
MNEGEEEDLCDHYFDIIIQRRSIPRRTNWRHCANALSQREVALAGNIQSSANDHLFVLLS